MDFFEFEIRAWQTEDGRAAVLVHSSPAGEMRKPCLVPLHLQTLRDQVGMFRRDRWATSDPAADHLHTVTLGRALASLLLPPPVHVLFRRSIERTSRDAGLRLRLCLDESLIDMPWELLFDPDEPDDSQHSGFLALSGRVSLVRCARVAGRKFRPGQNPQRLVFAGALSGYKPGDDDFQVRAEHEALTAALADISGLVTVEDFVDASGDNIDQRLSTSAVIFHYAGHTEEQHGKGVLLRSFENKKAAWLRVEALVPMLQRARVQLVVLNSCDGGHWPVVKAFLDEGLDLAAVIGIQGRIATKASIAFCSKLYQALALGLSLDEAVTWARLHVLEHVDHMGATLPFHPYAWPRFMVYMPVSSAVLFEKSNDPEGSQVESDAQAQRAQTINHVTNIIGSVYGGNVSGISSAAVFNETPGQGVESEATVPDAPLPLARATIQRAPGTRTLSKSARDKMPKAPDFPNTLEQTSGSSNTPREYLDLSIELRDVKKAADTFVVSVLPSAVGESKPVKVMLNMPELDADLVRLENKKLSMTKLMALGERLGDRLLPVGEVRDLFHAAMAKAGRTGGVRLRLVIRDAVLAQLPWEYAYLQKSGGEKHRSGFLSLNPQISMVRHEALPEEPWPLVAADASRLRVVVATAAVTHADIDGLGAYDFGELDLDVERNAVVAALRDLKVDGVTVDAGRVLQEATIHDVTDALVTGADVFHFAGHGYFSTAERDTASVARKFGGMILLHANHGSPEGAIMRADDLAVVLQRAGVRLAVLGACESARRDHVSEWSGVAPALVRRGLPAVVAMQYEVLDEQAIACSRMLYTCMAAGLSLDEAVSAGRQAMLASSDGNNVEWGVPVLYMRTTSGALFPEIVRKDTVVATQLRVAIEQVVETIETGGEVVGIRAEQLSDGSFSVTQRADVVKGTMVGVVLGKI